MGQETPAPNSAGDRIKPESTARHGVAKALAHGLRADLDTQIARLIDGATGLVRRLGNTGEADAAAILDQAQTQASVLRDDFAARRAAAVTDAEAQQTTVVAEIANQIQMLEGAASTEHQAAVAQSETDRAQVESAGSAHAAIQGASEAQAGRVQQQVEAQAAGVREQAQGSLNGYGGGEKGNAQSAAADQVGRRAISAIVAAAPPLSQGAQSFGGAAADTLINRAARVAALFEQRLGPLSDALGRLSLGHGHEAASPDGDRSGCASGASRPTARLS